MIAMVDGHAEEQLEPEAAASAPEGEATDQPQRELPCWVAGMDVQLEVRRRHEPLFVSGCVQSVAVDVLELAIQIASADVPLLRAGGEVRVSLPGRPGVAGQILTVRAGEPTLTLVRMFGDGSDERRSSQRYLMVEPLPATVSQLIDGHLRVSPGLVIDVSTGGIGLLTTGPAEVGARLHIRLRAGAPAAPLTLIIRVVWTAATSQHQRCGAVFADDPGLKLDALFRRAFTTELRQAGNTRGHQLR